MLEQITVRLTKLSLLKAAASLIMFRNSKVVFHINHCPDQQKVMNEILIFLLIY